MRLTFVPLECDYMYIHGHLAVLIVLVNSMNAEFGLVIVRS